jgi:hypothetical protein
MIHIRRCGRGRGSGRRLRLRPLLGLVAGLALLLVVPLSALAAPGPQPEGGVTGAQPYCARDYERLHGDHYISYNDDFGSYTCLRSRNQQTSANFTVTTWNQGNQRIGAFPNIFAGWEYGRHPARSWNPVQEAADGSPQAYVDFSSIPGADYNGAWDIWFNRTDPADPSTIGQNNGAEVMIWLVNHTGFHPTWTVSIEHVRWQVMAWIATNRATGVQWHYLAFIAPHDIPRAALWLNPFFDEAIALGDLNRDWYLTSVAFGYELAAGHFDGMSVRDFAVNYVGVPGKGPDPHDPPAPRTPPRSIRKQPPPRQPKHEPKPAPRPTATPWPRLPSPPPRFHVTPGPAE